MSCCHRSKKEYDETTGGDTTVPSRRFPVVDSHTTSSRKDKVSFLFVAIAGDVSRAGRFCYIMHAVSPQVRSFSTFLFVSLSLPLFFSFFHTGDPRFPPKFSLSIFRRRGGGRIDATHRQRNQTRFLDRGLCFVRRLSLSRCNNAGLYVYTRAY